MFNVTPIPGTRLSETHSQNSRGYLTLAVPYARQGSLWGHVQQPTLSVSVNGTAIAAGASITILAASANQYEVSTIIFGMSTGGSADILYGGNQIIRGWGNGLWIVVADIGNMGIKFNLGAAQAWTLRNNTGGAVDLTATMFYAVF